MSPGNGVAISLYGSTNNINEANVLFDQYLLGYEMIAVIKFALLMTRGEWSDIGSIVEELNSSKTESYILTDSARIEAEDMDIAISITFKPR